MNLSKGEEQLMEFIWQLGKPFMKELIDAYPDPKPAPTTVATLLKRMHDKGFVSYDTMGNSRQYRASVSKEAYFSGQFKGIVRNFFNDSVGQFASFFAGSGRLTQKELEELKAVIDQQIKKKKK